MTTKLLSLYGVKLHPFRPDVPVDALFTTPAGRHPSEPCLALADEVAPKLSRQG